MSTATKLGPSLIEAWLYYCIGHNCPDGQKAQQHLRGLLAKGIVADKAVWDATPEDIKKRFYQEFGRPAANKAMEAAQTELDYAEEAYSNAKLAKFPAKVTNALKAEVEVKKKALVAATPKDVHPIGTSTAYSGTRPSWKKKE